VRVPPHRSKVQLYAAIRRDSREGLSNREIERKYSVGWRTVQAAQLSAWPAPRKAYPRRASKLDRFKPAIDTMLRSDLDAPKKQHHTIQSSRPREAVLAVVGSATHRRGS
jgi:hypothetical protein